MPDCRLCGSPGIVIRPLGPTRLAYCPSCTVSFLDPMPTEERTAGLYETDYHISDDDVVSTERRRIFRLPEQIALIAELARHRPAPGTVLDVGCDKGYFLDEIRRFGYAPIGVEPGRAARQYCERIGIPVHARLDEVTDQFDLVTLWHTLEHVPDPVPFVRNLLERLVPGGLLAVRVPDFGCVWRRVLGARWVWFQPRHHCFHYTARGLRTLLELCGTKVLELRSQKPNDWLTAAAYRVATKTFARRMGIRPTLRKQLGRLVEDATGVELVALAQKPAAGVASDATARD